MDESGQQAHIMLVEDDARLATLIGDYLGQNGYRVTVEPRGDTAPARILAEQPRLVVLDLMLPGRDGLSVCQQVRHAYSGPILILTARDDDMDQVAGLEIGADDYVMKPVEPRVLLARIRALLRRTDATSALATGSQGQELALGALRISPGSRTVRLNGDPVELTSSEFDLLCLLATQAGRTVSRDELCRQLHGHGYDGLDRSVDIAVSRLRKKLEIDPSRPQRIRTVWGRGYLFAIDAW